MTRLSPIADRTKNIIREIRTGSPSDETKWLPNKEMSKLCEVSDETSTKLVPALSVSDTPVCDTSTLKPLGSGGPGPGRLGSA